MIVLERGSPDYIEWEAITASAELKLNEISYDPRLFTEWDGKTAWVEGIDGDGIGEWIKLERNEPVEVSAIVIDNGYKKSEHIFDINNRIKRVKIEFSDGTSILRDLFDGFSYNNQVFLDNPITTNFIKITILDIYKGIKYPNTCISEIHAY